MIGEAFSRRQLTYRWQFESPPLPNITEKKEKKLTHECTDIVSFFHNLPQQLYYSHGLVVSQPTIVISWYC